MSASIELWSEDQDFLNCRQAAAFLGVSETTFYRIRMSKGIPQYPFSKQPKFKISDLIEFRESQRIILGNFAKDKNDSSLENSRVRLPGR